MAEALSKHQKQRIKRQQTQKINDETVKARVISHLGYQIVIQVEGVLQSAVWRKQIKDIAINDSVAVSCKNNQWIIEAVYPRRSVLSKWQSRKLKAIASNIDQLLIVVAVEPTWQNALIDRFMIAANQAGIDLVIFCNKIDLLTDQSQLVIVKERLKIYEQLGHQVIYGSCHDKESLNDLMGHLKDKVTVICGQSGVGKSSLTKALIKDVDIWIQAISSVTGLGKHTTTNAKLYAYNSDTAIIDTPGIRGFAITHFDNEHLKLAFPEILKYASDCKFNNCKHINEPNCAVLKAVDEKLIDKQRYDSLMQMLESKINER